MKGRDDTMDHVFVESGRLLLRRVSERDRGVLERLGFECLGRRYHECDDLPGFEAQALWGLTRAARRREST
jgi:hypothetical protein